MKWALLLLAQAVWFAAVLLGAAWALPLALAQLVLLSFAPTLRFPVRVYVLIILSGLSVDYFLQAMQWIAFRPDPLFADLSLPLPAWLIVLWCSFALTVKPLSELVSSSLLRALLFAGGGAAAYYAGVRLGAAEILNYYAYFSVLILIWMLFPGIWLWFASRFSTKSSPSLSAPSS